MFPPPFLHLTYLLCLIASPVFSSIFAIYFPHHPYLAMFSNSHLPPNTHAPPISPSSIPIPLIFLTTVITLISSFPTSDVLHHQSPPYSSPLPLLPPSLFLSFSLFCLSLSSWQPYSRAHCSARSSEPCPALLQTRLLHQLTCP